MSKATAILFGLLAAATAAALSDEPDFTGTLTNKWRVKTITVVETVTVTVDGAVPVTVPTSSSVPVLVPSSSVTKSSSTKSTSTKSTSTKSTSTKSTSTTTSSTLPVSSSAPATPSNSPATTVSTNGNDVFAHYMLGIVGEHTAADWESDFANALEYGVSAFALNFGPNDGSTDTQLQLAYAAAEKVGFKLFLSFDFNSGYYTAGDVQKVADRIKPYANHPAQYIVDGKPLVSSFLGEDMDWSAVADAVGMPIFASPMSTNPNGGTLQSKGASGLLSWNAWASQNNQPINAVITLATDKPFFSAAESANLDYIMPVSPWFFTHYGKDVPYSKNFLFKSEDQWLTRWNEILTSEPRARFLEILTWNDFGESSYLVDPAAVQAADDGHSRWTKGFSHADLMVMAKPFISAFKTGATAPVVETEGAVYWYRPHLKSAECDSTDNYGSKPTGWELVDDTVFVAVITKNGGTLTVTSGGNAPVTEKVEAGVQMVKVPMGAGAQTFQLKTTDGASLSGKGVHDISADCIDGQYNYNINVGSLA